MNEMSKPITQEVVSKTWTAGLTQLDLHTLAEDFCLGFSLESHWELLGRSMNTPPSQWKDKAGERMYGAVLFAETWFDLDNPVLEDEIVTAETRLVAIRKPHALSETVFSVDGVERARVLGLTSLVRRVDRGSNKRFARVRDIWTADDHDPDRIDDILEKHHQNKSAPARGTTAMTYEVNRIQDFNRAGLFYFKNFVRVSKSAEWCANRGNPTRLNSNRQVFYYGNCEDGEMLDARVDFDGEDMQSELYNADGKRLFLSLAVSRPVEFTIF